MAETVTLLTENFDHQVVVQQHGAAVMLSFRYHPEMVTAVKRFDRAQWISDKKVWAFPASKRNIWALRAMCENSAADRYRQRSKVWTPTGERYSTQLKKFVPHRAKQCEMIGHGLTKRQCIIGAEMRTGKSLAYIEIMETYPDDLWWYAAPSKALVSFELELDNWGSKVRPEMMTYDEFKKRVERGEKPRHIIYDEGSKLKGHSQRTKAAIKMADAQDTEWPDETSLRILGTGTPQPKNLLDWFFQVESVRPGFLPWGNIHKLTEYLQVRQKAEGLYGNDFWQMIQWKDGSECVLCAGSGLYFRKPCEYCSGKGVQPDHCAAFKALLADVALIVRKSEVLELPEKEIVVYTGRMPKAPEEKVTYVIDPRLVPPPSMLNVAKIISEQGGTATQILEKHRELTDGFQYQHKVNDKGKKVRDSALTIRGKTPKDPLTLELLAKHEEVGRFVIYSAYTETTDKLCNMAAKAGWKVMRCDGAGWRTWDGRDEKAALLEFMAGERSSENKICFIGHPKSAGYALDLSASPGFLFYSMDFDGETYMQAIERGHSSGMNFDLGCTLYFFEILPTCRLVRLNLSGKHSGQEITKDDIQRAYRRAA